MKFLMNRFRVAVLVILAQAAAASAQDWVKVAKLVSPAVVKVVACDEQGRTLGFGSGFVIRADGLVATNYHVVQKAPCAKVYTSNGAAYEVEGVVAFDTKKDFVILKVAGARLTAAPLGNSDLVRVGEAVAAIGHPQGSDGTVSNGIISGIRDDGEVVWLQTTAAISPGSSGGPLINRRAEVIGMITFFGASENWKWRMPKTSAPWAWHTGWQSMRSPKAPRFRR
jgi:S1-C subfamily serine protease